MILLALSDGADVRLSLASNGEPDRRFHVPAHTDAGLVAGEVPSGLGNVQQRGAESIGHDLMYRHHRNLLIGVAQ